ncbi:MAG TPA: hypothetical protein VFZ85_10495 [Jiangellaceae bacterium]
MTAVVVGFVVRVEVNGRDPDLLDEEDPFEIDSQVAHLFKHPPSGIEDIDDVWASDRFSTRPSRRRIG